LILIVITAAGHPFDLFDVSFKSPACLGRRGPRIKVGSGPAFYVNFLENPIFPLTFSFFTVKILTQLMLIIYFI
jgi:hypothetical protein